jgi:transposase
MLVGMCRAGHAATAGRIIERMREEFVCRDCKAITEPPASAHPIPRSFARPSLLAMILVGKFGEHLPLNRQSAGFARERIEEAAA